MPIKHLFRAALLLAACAELAPWPLPAMSGHHGCGRDGAAAASRPYRCCGKSPARAMPATCWGSTC
jgi:hypothetical protein